MRACCLVASLLFVLAPWSHGAVPVATAAFTGGEQGRIILQAKVNGKGPFPFTSLEVAGFQIASPRTSLSFDDAGVEGGDADGNVGASILREFNWIYDVPHKCVYLHPNKWFQKAALEDHSGLVLDTRAGFATVLSVFPNSSAAKAGLHAGDHLIGINGQGLTTDEWHDLFDAPPGTAVFFRVTHQSKNRTITLTLATYD